MTTRLPTTGDRRKREARSRSTTRRAHHASGWRLLLLRRLFAELVSERSWFRLEPRCVADLRRLEIIQPAGLVVSLVDHEPAAVAFVHGPVVPQVDVPLVHRQDLDLARCVRHAISGPSGQPRALSQRLPEKSRSLERSALRTARCPPLAVPGTGSTAGSRCRTTPGTSWPAPADRRSQPLDQRTLIDADHAVLQAGVQTPHRHLSVNSRGWSKCAIR